jgi:glycosyltransferase involved in cell wall biosynthesis
LKQGRNILLLYDFLAIPGGAERVLAALYEVFAADVCVGYVGRDAFADRFAPDRLIDLGAYSAFDPLMIVRVLHAFSTAGRTIAGRYSTRIFSGHYAVLAANAAQEGRSIYYCHSPPRFLYDLREKYQREFAPWKRPLLAALRSWLQPRYELAVQAMDVVVANSENVRRRLRTYLGREAEVVYPPVDVDLFRWIDDGGFFLSTARLEPLKRVDRVVEAFCGMPEQKLVVASGGAELARLQALAAGAPNIRFTGWLDDGQLARLMGEARATIYLPVDEDFGISPVESMAAGKPVLGVAEGGLLESVTDGETGSLLPPAFGTGDLQEAVRQMTRERARSMRADCEARARRFSRRRFAADMKALVG